MIQNTQPKEEKKKKNSSENSTEMNRVVSHGCTNEALVLDESVAELLQTYRTKG